MRPYLPAAEAAPRRPRARLAALALIIVVGLLAFLLWRGIPALSSLLAGKPMTGEFLAAAAVPSPDGGVRLWILTDASFHYIQRIETPGRTSVARKCRACKTWLYVYDPVRDKVLTKFRTDYKSLILHTWMAAVDGRIWVATGPYDKNEPRISVYDAEPAALRRELPDVLARHSELASGLVNLRMEKGPARLILDTRDGRTGLVLSLADDKLYESLSELERSLASEEIGTATAFALAEEGSGPRKRLFKVSGPRSKLDAPSLEFALRNPGHVAARAQLAVEPLVPDRAFIDGLIVQQDADGCLILYQDAAGRTANRLLSRVDAAGAVRWTAGPAELFKEFRVDLDRDPFTQTFFLKDRVELSRTGSLVLLQLKGVGFAGFELESGRKLWEVRF